MAISCFVTVRLRGLSCCLAVAAVRGISEPRRRRTVEIGDASVIHVKKKANLYSAFVLYYKLLISKALRYGPRVTRGSHSFTFHPHTNHTLCYLSTLIV